ncbi:MAG: transglutaminase domain-containing protein [Pirellulales bacterium]
MIDAPHARKHSFARRARTTCLVAAMLSVAAATLAGCDGKTSAERLREAGFDPASRAVSFDAIADRLNNLDQAVKAHNEASLPADVIVDATRSTDSEPVMGVVTDGPQQSGTFEFLHVPQGNVEFAALGVRPGDVVEYLIEIPKAGNIAELEFFKKTRLDGRKSIQAYVAKVVDAHTLLLDAPLPTLSEGQSYPLAPIVVTRPSRERIDHLERVIADWESTGSPAFWTATPDRDALDALIVQLNQWIEREQVDGVKAPKYVRSDAILLQEAVWLRDIARRAEAVGDPLAKAALLFDWVVDNIQLDDSLAALGITQRPWLALMTGRATADERAWLYVLLLRQANIDAAALRVPGVGKETTNETRLVWTVAVHAGDNWRLFDPALGLPIPGPNGESIATLEQVKADDAVLRQLDVDATHRYPYTAEQVRHAAALIEEETALYLAQRGEPIERQLAGANRIVFVTPLPPIVSAIRPHVASVDTWRMSQKAAESQRTLSPAARSVLAEQFRVFARAPALWKGRVLQFRGDDHQSEFDYADRPVRVYAQQRDPRWYFTQYCRTADRDLAAADAARFPIESLRTAKHFAAVWMGCLAYEDGDFAEALAYFGPRTLDRPSDALLRPLARQGLARTHERIAKLLDELARRDEEMPNSGGTIEWIPATRRLLAAALSAAAAEQRAAAAALYEADDSAQQHGSIVRARRLRSALATADSH